MRKRNKKHWVERLPSLACGGIARPGSAQDTCGLLWVHCGASVYRDLATANPDWYCVTCTKAARLALAAESAPKPSDIVWPTPRPISEARETEIFGYCPDIGWRRLSQIGRKWALTGAEHIADYEPTHFLPLPPEVR